MGSVAAPFLAGIAIALAVLVISNGGNFGAVGMTLFALVGGTAGFIACVECAFMARQYAVTPSQLEEWRPNLVEANRIEKLQTEQSIAFNAFNRWADRARWAYNAGIVAFAWGVASLLIPPGGLDRADDWRLAAFALACGGLVAEIVSVLISWWKSRGAA
jgi:hypothetical protein